MIGTVMTACIDTVSLKIETTTFIYTSANDQFYLNGLEKQVTNTEEMVPLEDGGCSLSVVRPDDREMKIQVLNLGFTLTMRRHLSLTSYISIVTVEISSTYCCSSPPTSGMCGGCTGCTGSEVFTPCSLDSTTSPEITPTDDNMLPDADSLVVTEDIDLTAVNGLGPGNAACFEGGTMISEKSDIFTTDNDDPVTIEFFVKTCWGAECFGTIFSYTYVKTFTVRNYYGKVKITYGDFEHQTDLQLVDNTYTQISLVFDGYDYLGVYIDNCNGNLRKEFIKLPVYDTHPFTGRGNLVLGKWLPAPDRSGIQPIGERFKGCIDVLRIWKRYLYKNILLIVKQ